MFEEEMSNKDLSNISKDQFPFLIHKLISKKQDLLKWAKSNQKIELVRSLLDEISILKEAEHRLEEKNGL